MTRTGSRSYAPRSEAEVARALRELEQLAYVWDSFRFLETAFASERLRLDNEDDLALWRVAITTIIGECQAFYADDFGRQTVLAWIGSCSHWIRPHQRRYKVAGGFASPHGYSNAGGGYAFSSLPEFDWSVTWKQNEDCRSWSLSKGRPGRRPLVLRIAIPARTARHEQCAVHTIWDPGTPAVPKQKAEQLYFFRRFEEGWLPVADIIEEP